MSEQALSIFTIFWSPRDYPGVYVVREFFILRGEVVSAGNCFVETTLEKVRLFVSGGRVRMERSPDDDASVVESWI